MPKKNYLDDPHTPFRVELCLLFQTAKAEGRVLYPDQAMQELEAKSRERVGHNRDPRQFSRQERKDATKLWRDIYHAAVDYHFDFYRGLADRGGRPSKAAEFLETAKMKAKGLSNTQIGLKLGISRSAVLKRRSAVKKLLPLLPPALP